MQIRGKKRTSKTDKKWVSYRGNKKQDIPPFNKIICLKARFYLENNAGGILSCFLCSFFKFKHIQYRLYMHMNQYVQFKNTKNEIKKNSSLFLTCCFHVIFIISRHSIQCNQTQAVNPTISFRVWGEKTKLTCFWSLVAISQVQFDGVCLFL